MSSCEFENLRASRSIYLRMFNITKTKLSSKLPKFNLNQDKLIFNKKFFFKKYLLKYLTHVFKTTNHFKHYNTPNLDYNLKNTDFLSKMPKTVLIKINLSKFVFNFLNSYTLNIFKITYLNKLKRLKNIFYNLIINKNECFFNYNLSISNTEILTINIFFVFLHKNIILLQDTINSYSILPNFLNNTLHNNNKTLSNPTKKQKFNKIKSLLKYLTKNNNSYLIKINIFTDNKYLKYIKNINHFSTKLDFNQQQHVINFNFIITPLFLNVNNNNKISYIN